MKYLNKILIFITLFLLVSFSHNASGASIGQIQRVE